MATAHTQAARRTQWKWRAGDVSNGSLAAQNLYLRDVRQTPTLATEEEAGLFAQVALGAAERLNLHPDTDLLNLAQVARNRLVESYQPLVISIARRISVQPSSDLSLLDYVQEGNVALLEGISGFDGHIEIPMFFSWLVQRIRWRMVLAAWQRPGGIVVPYHQLRALRMLAKAQSDLLLCLEHEPTPGELAAYLHWSARRLNGVLALQSLYVGSIDVVSYPNWDPTSHQAASLVESIADPLTVPVAADLCASEHETLHEELHRAINNLPARERAVIILRFGFADGVAHTLQETADDMGLSYPLVTSLERRARMRLRTMLDSVIPPYLRGDLGAFSSESIGLDC